MSRKDHNRQITAILSCMALLLAAIVVARSSSCPQATPPSGAVLVPSAVPTPVERIHRMAEVP